ncbi:MAG TPA: hypothetical protein VHB77_19520 [Planctomycetaceae bacterium]|nr:hypothetical protein [Planctomycetaceae bacterium]
MHRVLILGSLTADISAACSAAGFESTHATSLDAALATTDSPPDLVVVVLDWPDQWSEADIGQLLQTFPLARLVCSYGPWCDSDGRNRDLWPPGARVPRELTAARLARELHSLETGSGAVLPLTGGRDEVFEYDCGECLAISGLRIAVQSPDRAYREMLESAVRKWGGSIVAIDSNPAVILWDADPWDAERREQLAALVAARPQSQIIALVGFLRDEAVAEILAAGARVVCPKLAPLSQLADHVRELSMTGMGQRSE